MSSWIDTLTRTRTPLPQHHRTTRLPRLRTPSAWLFVGRFQQAASLPYSHLHNTSAVNHYCIEK